MTRRGAYVSASSRGLAFEIARELARGGHDVALSSRHEDRLRLAADAIQAEFPDSRIETVRADLSQPEDQQRVLDELDRRAFSVDVFVCSAGQPEAATLQSLGRQQWQHDLEMMLAQAVFAAGTLVPRMADRGFGRVILLSSSHVRQPQNEFVSSSLARAGLLALSKIIVDGYARKGVAPFIVTLGFVDTPLLRNMALGRAWDGPPPDVSAVAEPWAEQYQRWAAGVPAGRIGTALELAQLVRFLASPESAYLAGSLLSFSGGLERGLV